MLRIKKLAAALVVTCAVCFSMVAVGVAGGRSSPRSSDTPENSNILYFTPSFTTDGSEDAEILGRLLREYEHIQFTELVSGDASAYPTIFYNDVAYPIDHEESQAAIDAFGVDGIAAAIAAAQSEPGGAESGFLTEKIVEHLSTWQNIEAWDAIQSVAAAEGRQPTYEELLTMPGGQTPYPKKNPEEWMYVPYYVFDVVRNNDNATAKLAYIEGADAVGDWLTTSYFGVYEIFWFTQVDGQWYMSKQQSVVCPCAAEPPIIP